MNLIGKNKINEFIKNTPEARVSLLTWLKEFPNLAQRMKHFTEDGKPVSGSIEGTFMPDQGEYVIKHLVNTAADALLITWVGKRETFEVIMEQEFKKMQQQDPSLEQSVKIIEIVVVPPPPIFEEFSALTENKKTEANPYTPPLSSMRIEVPIQDLPLFNPEPELNTEGHFKTESEYEEGLARVVSIFEALPDTLEFEALLDLVPLVKNYETYKLVLPSLPNFEAVKHKIEVLNMTPANFAAIVGSEDEMNQFLSGELVLSDEVLSRLYKAIFLRFPVGA